MGLLQPRRRLDALRRRDLPRVPTHARARLGIGYMPEDRRLIPDLTVEENILLPAWAGGAADAASALREDPRMHPGDPRARVRARARSSRAGSRSWSRSARALMCGTRLLLLDEPFEGVAPALAQRLAEVVRGLKDAGMTVILSESDLQHSERLVDRVVSIDRGAISTQTQ